MEDSRKKIAVLGSTGSIGTQTLDIVRNNPDKFKITVLTANKNWELLSRQALEFKPSIVVIADENFYSPLKERLQDSGIEVGCGAKKIVESAARDNVHLVVTAMVGYSGLLPTISAIRAGKTIALSNKETLVVAGSIITRLAKEFNSDIIPVDSEHSAIFQCLVGEDRNKMRKILLTASGGPFRKFSKEMFEKITVKEALNHPNWSMGAKVTIDSASMMNKGFEMIEAKWLFNCSPDDIEIMVHPESIIHSMVEFCDGSVKAQLGVPDMHIPISYALGFPERLNSDSARLDLTKIHSLTFEKPDYEKFPLLRYAFDAIKKGGNMPCILNASNEVAVRSFLNEKLSFVKMADLVRFTMDHCQFISDPTLDDLIATNSEALQIAEEWLLKHSN